LVILPRRNSRHAKYKLFKEIISAKLCPQFSLTLPPPSNGVAAPIVHRVNDFYKDFYNLKKIISKPDRYGLYLKTEDLILEIFQLSIAAALSEKLAKAKIVQELKIKIEVSKRLIRLMSELNIITQKKYITLETNLQEISKMAANWYKYLIKKEP